MSLPRALALSLLALLPSPLHATSDEPSSEDEGGEEEVDLLDTSACPQIFGQDEVREQNASYRERRLHDVRIGEKKVEIVHSVGRWNQPHLLRMTGIELVGVELPDPDPEADPDPDERVALIELGEELEAVCPPGIYAVATDDALGRRGQILDIDDRGVLVESKGTLAFLPWEGHPIPPRVRMIWRSSYDIVLENEGSSASKASKGKRKRPKKRRAKPKRRRRRRR